METNVKNIIPLCGCLLFVLFFVPVFSWAEPFQLNGPVSFETAYPTPDGRTKTHTWQVSPDTTEDAFRSMVFRPEKSASSAPPFCRIDFLPEEEGDVRIRWTGAGGVVRNGRNGMLLMSGFPVACDILPVHQEGEEKTYSEKTEAGGRTFVKSITVRKETIAPEKAKDEGWIKKGRDDDLVLFSAVDDEGKLMVRQLWAENGDWWLYEETPFRRSWRTQ